jgi:hypothetical protein
MHMGDEAARGAGRAGRREFGGPNLYRMARARVALAFFGKLVNDTGACVTRALRKTIMES